MKISCPQCDAEYDLPQIEPEALQNNMQCSHCQHRFIPDGEHSHTVTNKVKPVRHIDVTPTTNFEGNLMKSDPARSDLRMKAQMLVNDLQDDGNSDRVDPVNIEGELDVSNLSEEAVAFVSLGDEEIEFEPQKSKPKGNWLNIAAVIGAIMIFGGGLVVRDRVVSTIPSLASLYKLAGINLNSRGLEFASVKSKTVLKNDKSVLIIEGMIKNVTSESVDIPAVRLLMRAADKQEISAWFHEPVQMRLKAGESMIFSTRLKSPPLDVRDVHLNFTDRRKQQAKLN
jgi:hypothetical protein